MKQSTKDLFRIYIVFVIGIGFFSAMLGATLHILSVVMEDTKQDQENRITPYCSYECQKYDMQFHELVNDGWRWDCWCMADKPHFTKRFDGGDYQK